MRGDLRLGLGGVRSASRTISAISLARPAGPCRRARCSCVIVVRRAHLAEDARLRSSPLASVTSPKANVPRPAQRAIRPMIMPKSPTRLTMNALLAAFEALLRSM